MNRVLLDTSIVIEIIKNNEAVQDQLSIFPVLQFTLLGLGELYYGAHNSTQLEKHLAECQDVQAKLTILPLTNAIVEQYGIIRGQLRRAGTMLPENDI